MGFSARVLWAFIDGRKPVERLPSGLELHKLYDSINVTNAELVSDAELAWQYGDAAKAEAAANDDRSRAKPAAMRSG